MKRLIIVASLAILAVGCQKTFVENEVLTPIGFNTEVSKQTRAIFQEETYSGESFGVYAWGHQGNSKNLVMDNVQITGTTVDGVTSWKPSTGAYYWPNDTETYLNFYAYSPYSINAVLDQNETALTLTDYTHTATDLDFMVAVPVKGAKYADQNGSADGVITGSVPVAFKHQMTQIVFKVKETAAEGIIVKLKRITLDNVVNQASYSIAVDTYNGTPTWRPVATGTYTLFSSDAGETVTANGIESTPATVIPQTLTASVANDPNVVGNKFTVVYEISGTGVATETVTKTLDLYASPVVAWNPNMKVTYTLTVGLNEISFNPTVTEWTPSAPNSEIPIN